MIFHTHDIVLQQFIYEIRWSVCILQQRIQYIHTYIHIYIYIYREREREKIKQQNFNLILLSVRDNFVRYLDYCFVV